MYGFVVLLKLFDNLRLQIYGMICCFSFRRSKPSMHGILTFLLWWWMLIFTKSTSLNLWSVFVSFTFVLQNFRFSFISAHFQFVHFWHKEAEAATASTHGPCFSSDSYRLCSNWKGICEWWLWQISQDLWTWQGKFWVLNTDVLFESPHDQRSGLNKAMRRAQSSGMWHHIVK